MRHQTKKKVKCNFFSLIKEKSITLNSFKYNFKLKSTTCHFTNHMNELVNVKISELPRVLLIKFFKYFNIFCCCINYFYYKNNYLIMSLQQNAQNDDSDSSDSDSADENRRRRVFKNRNRFVYFFVFFLVKIIFSFA